MTDRRSEAVTDGVEAESSGLRIERLGIDEATPELLAELKDLLDLAYVNGHMYDDLVEDVASRPEVFRLFVARKDGQPVGVRVIERKPHEGIEYFDFEPVHGKRFTVHPDHRGEGVGGRMMAEGRRYAFDELDLPAVFGESNELGAISMYGREGALFQLSTITEFSHRNTPEQNLRFFREFLTNPAFREYRLPRVEGSPGVLFVEVRDEHIARFFRERGYVTRAELLGEASA
jgi:GNAT superfamily N-acetyltransferase